MECNPRIKEMKILPLVPIQAILRDFIDNHLDLFFFMYYRDESDIKTILKNNKWEEFTDAGYDEEYIKSKKGELKIIANYLNKINIIDEDDLIQGEEDVIDITNGYSLVLLFYKEQTNGMCVLTLKK